MHDINKFDLLKVNQFGFRLCRATADAIISFKRKLRSNFLDLTKVTQCNFINLKKALSL